LSKRSWFAGLLALALFAGACSSSKKSSSTATTSAVATTAAGGTATTAASGGSTLKLSKPVKIVLLAEIVGESAIAVNYYNNGIMMAIDAINKAGGIGGQQVQLVRYPASPLDPQNSNAAYLKALDQNPTAIIGLPGGGTQLAGVLTNVERGGVPLLIVSLGDSQVYYGSKGGSQWAWFMEQDTSAVAAAGANYYIQDLGAKKIGFMGTNEGYGNSSLAGVKSALSAAGLQPYAVKQYSPTATDLTAEVLAMKGADAVTDYGYPNPFAVQLKQFQQNGLSIPSINGGSSFIVVQQKLASGDAIAKLYASTACNPPGATEGDLKTFATTYQQRFNESPGQEAAVSYDSMFVLKAAIEKAGSADPKAVNDALGQVTVDKDIVCSPKYHADGAHILDHTVAISSFSADGTSKVVKTITTPDNAKASS
jgi:branched-chain amino acid transport system substrate-binding protein